MTLREAREILNIVLTQLRAPCPKHLKRYNEIRDQMEEAHAVLFLKQTPSVKFSLVDGIHMEGR